MHTVATEGSCGRSCSGTWIQSGHRSSCMRKCAPGGWRLLRFAGRRTEQLRDGALQAAEREVQVRTRAARSSLRRPGPSIRRRGRGQRQA